MFNSVHRKHLYNKPESSNGEMLSTQTYYLVEPATREWFLSVLLLNITITWEGTNKALCFLPAKRNVQRNKVNRDCLKNYRKLSQLKANFPKRL